MKTQATKEKIDRLDFFKIKKFCASKGHYPESEKTAIEKIFANQISDKECSSGNSHEGRLAPPDSLWGKVVTRGPRRGERGCRTGTASRGFLGFVTERKTINVASHSLFPTCRLSLMKGMMRVHNNAGIRGGEACGWSLQRAMSQGAPLPPGGQAPPGAPCLQNEQAFLSCAH